MGDTTIEWTQKTWNPVRGCSRVSEGCRHCYAETMAGRFSGPGQPYQGLVKLAAREVRQFKTVGGEPTGDFRTVTRSEARWTGVVRMVPERLADPLRWRKPRRIFVNSMSDLFHEALPNEQIAAVFGVMAAAPQHTFQVLTKRAERMRDWFRWAAKQERWMEYLELAALDALGHLVESIPRQPFRLPWPLPNVWLGVSVENQAAADERIPLLLETPAALRFLSCEPLLGSTSIWAFLNGKVRDESLAILGSPPMPGVDWVIAGCESGPGARPAEVDWYRALRDQCAAGGVPFFLKQAWVEFWPDGMAPPSIAITTGPGSERKAGGVIGLPYLDGVQHAEFPGPR